MSHAFGWQLASGAICVAVGGATFLPNLLPGFTKRFYQRYKTGSENTPEEVDEKVLLLVDNVLQELGFPKEKESKLDIFYCHSTQPFYSGSMYVRGHCLLGLPFTFKYFNEDDLERDKEHVFKRNFPWTHSAAQPIKDALLLDNEEKEFIIARQLGYLDTQNLFTKLVQRTLCIAVAFFSAHFVNYKQGLYKNRSRIRNAGVRIGVNFSMFGLAGAVVAVFLNDSYNCYLDRYADKYAAKVSKVSAEAGRRYYDKILNGNIAMRKVVPGADKKFTIYGNEQGGLLRTKTLPLVNRRDFMLKMCQSKD